MMKFTKDAFIYEYLLLIKLHIKVKYIYLDINYLFT